MHRTPKVLPPIVFITLLCITHHLIFSKTFVSASKSDAFPLRCFNKAFSTMTFWRSVNEAMTDRSLGQSDPSSGLFLFLKNSCRISFPRLCNPLSQFGPVFPSMDIGVEITEMQQEPEFYTFECLCSNFILPETGKPCLLFCLLQFAQLIVPYLPAIQDANLWRKTNSLS